MSTTRETVTQEQIHALRSEAAAAGDLDMVASCDLALDADSDGDRREDYDGALYEVVQALRSAEARS